METVTDFIFLGSKITEHGDCSHGMKRGLFLGRRAMTNLGHILKSRDITANKGPSSQSYGFPVVMCRCESWTIKKAEHQIIDAFELWCWRRLLRVPWIARRSNQSILKESECCSVKSDFLQPHGLYSPWNSPGQNTGMDSLSLLWRIFPTLLWRIFPTQGLNPGLLYCIHILYQLSHREAQEYWRVAYPFSSPSSRPRNWTGVSCTAGGFFTNWAMREFLKIWTQGKGNSGIPPQPRSRWLLKARSPGLTLL